jgi:flagellar motor switch protein FliG
MAARTQEKLSGIQKAAILMVLLGDKAASSVYRHLPHDDVEQLTREIARVDFVSNEQAMQVLEEFSKLGTAQEYIAKGGTEYAHRLLVIAFGEGIAKDLLQQLTRVEALSSQDLDLVQRADPQQLARLLEDENPQTIALLLAHLGIKMASALLRIFPEELAAEVVTRLARLRPSSPEIVQKIVGVLHKRIQSLGKQERMACGGVEAAAEVLNRLDGPVSKTILGSIEHQSTDLASAIRNQMFTFEDFLLAPEVSIREIVAQADKKALAMSLKGATAEVKEHFLKVMSSRAAEMLKEDIEVLGAVRARDVAQAQRELVDAARKLEAEGKIVLKNDEGDEEAYV